MEDGHFSFLYSAAACDRRLLIPLGYSCCFLIGHAKEKRQAIGRSLAQSATTCYISPILITLSKVTLPPLARLLETVVVVVCATTQ